MCIKPLLKHTEKTEVVGIYDSGSQWITPYYYNLYLYSTSVNKYLLSTFFVQGSSKWWKALRYGLGPPGLTVQHSRRQMDSPLPVFKTCHTLSCLIPFTSPSKTSALVSQVSSLDCNTPILTLHFQGWNVPLPLAPLPTKAWPSSARLSEASPLTSALTASLQSP